MHPSTSNLVLVAATFAGAPPAVGTGYLVKPDRVLTARHVVSHHGQRPETIRVRRANPAEWITDVRVDWDGSEHADAAVLTLEHPVADHVNVTYGSTTVEGGTRSWESLGYAGAASIVTEDDKLEHNHLKLTGVWDAAGGDGQSGRVLDLPVDHEVHDWRGISGAPVFVDGELIGIVREVLGTEAQPENKRLVGVPIKRITQTAGFLAATETVAHPVPDADDWFLVLLEEDAHPETEQLVEKTLPYIHNSDDAADGPPSWIKVAIDDELESPGRWLKLVELVTRAPVMIVDATSFQPAVMLVLGVRAVARRGVTVAITRHPLTETDLNELPFNIKETRLVSLAASAKWRLRRTVEAGRREMRDDPNYLDLPAYQAVRTRRAVDVDDMLVLCPFSAETVGEEDEVIYTPHWERVQQIVEAKTAHGAVRMLDIDSPRLVGQALYEQIRWNPACIVDWTWWRANVFFELGVRLACSRKDPVQVIHHAGGGVSPDGSDAELEQMRRLRRLFQPATYVLPHEAAPEDESVDEAFARYDADKDGGTVVVEAGMLPVGATHETVAAHYDWRNQDRVDRLPHTELRDSIEARVGKDPEKHATDADTLFSSNAAFSAALEARDRERWVAAWLYADRVLGTAARDHDGPERQELLRLGDQVINALKNSPRESDERLRNEITDLSDAWELDA